MGQKFYILWPINSFFVRIGGQVGIHLRVRLFWVKMISGNHFHPFPHVWLQRKIQYFRNCIPVNQNLPLWPGNEFTLSFSLQFISGSLSTHSNTERKREEKHKTNAHTERTRAPILKLFTETSDPQTHTSDPQTQSSDPRTQTSDPWTPDPAQPNAHRSSHFGHRAKHFSRWVFRHRFIVHTLTSPPTHTCPIHTLTSPVRSLHLYIYIFTYLFIY